MIEQVLKEDLILSKFEESAFSFGQQSEYLKQKMRQRGTSNLDVIKHISELNAAEAYFTQCANERRFFIIKAYQK